MKIHIKMVVAIDYSRALVVKNSFDVVKLVLVGKPITRQALEQYIDDEIIFDPPLPKPTDPKFRNEVYKRTNTGLDSTREPIMIDGMLVTTLTHKVFFKNYRGEWIMFG